MKKEKLTKPKLREIRNNCDWHKIIDAFWLEVDRKKSCGKNIFVKCPWTWEKNASLHINIDTGAWCNFSGGGTHENGWPIEFVQVYMKNCTGRVLNCYEAGHMLVEKGASFLYGKDSVVSAIVSKSRHHPNHLETWTPPSSVAGREEKKENPAIRQNLLPLLTEQGTHPQFTKRGISQKTCEYLWCGYLNREKWQLAHRIVFQVRGIKEEVQEKKWKKFDR